MPSRSQRSGGCDSFTGWFRQIEFLLSIKLTLKIIFVPLEYLILYMWQHIRCDAGQWRRQPQYWLSHYHSSSAGKYDVSLARACAPQCNFASNLFFSYRYKTFNYITHHKPLFMRPNNSWLQGMTCTDWMFIRYC